MPPPRRSSRSGSPPAMRPRDVLEKVTIADLAAKTLPPEIADKAAIEDAWRPH